MSQTATIIKKLLQRNEKIYVYLIDDEIGNKFIMHTESEGLTFNKGEKYTRHCYAEINAINNNYTIGFAGSIGRMTIDRGLKTVHGQNLFHVVFEKNIKGNEGYYYG